MSSPSLTTLDPRRPYKPLDVGEAGVTATVNADGRLLSVSQGHPEHGVVVLEAGPPLPEASRHDPDTVRRYRRRLAARNAAAFGLEPACTGARRKPSAARERPRAWLLEHAIPATGLPGVPRPALATFVPAGNDGAHGVVQVVLPGVAIPPLRWTAAVRLASAAYSELTEAGPLPRAPANPSAQVVGDHPVLHDPALGWAAALAGDLAPPSRVGTHRGRLRVEATLEPAGRMVALGLGPSPTEALAAARHLAALDPDDALEQTLERWRARWSGWPSRRGPLEPLARHGIAYVLACCAIPIGDTTCLATDHRILPLSWTRDAYFMAAALLAWTRAGGPAEAAQVVRRHLDWLFHVATRSQGWWARSHLVGGQPKDLVFQLDQQLYPLLELADYVETTGDRQTLGRHVEQVGAVLEAVDARRATCGLYSSDESPADDPLDLPYETANQILAWHTFRRLDRLGLGAGGRLRALAERVAAAVRRHQIVRPAGGPPVHAYATDLARHALVYHDANDLPMALAPAWGFCPPSDPVWLATMRLAFSEANPGFFPGRHGGLGSLHTPGPWPLGHAQALLVAHSTGDTHQVAAAERALAATALWDGALPEASDPRSGLPRSRPWFAWPGALAATIALDRQNRAPS
ncbi:MAG TPA: glycoside hydrolase family 125 protein [Actinomycetes bacterium]|nr:glycoside hydrolase family 125 protein [Actinomycetes bacterium]